MQCLPPFATLDDIYCRDAPVDQHIWDRSSIYQDGSSPKLCDEFAAQLERSALAVDVHGPTIEANALSHFPSRSRVADLRGTGKSICSLDGARWFMLYGMQQNIRKLAHPIRIGDWPHLVCPVCGVGGLGVGNFAHEHETGVKSHDEDPTDLRGRFSLQLVCGRASCQSWVILTGDYTTDFEPVTDTFIDVWPMLRVRTIYPPIPVMDLPEGLPESVRKAIVRASALIWLDPLAFAAALRSAVECLMDEQGVLVRHTGGRARLHDRLETFRQAQPVAGELLLAVKWVGNTGAHETASFTVDDALEAAEMVEVALGVVYAKDNSALLARAAAINAARRPVPRPTG